MKNGEFSSAYGDTLKDFGIRKTAAHTLLSGYRKDGTIGKAHLAGPIIEGFAYVGSVTSAISMIGGRSITAVEIEPSYVETGVMLGNYRSGVQKIESGVDMNRYLSSQAGKWPLASMIICLGLGFWYLDNPDQFRREALGSLIDGGLLLLSGIDEIVDIFSGYERESCGGKCVQGDRGTHVWDEYRYIEYK